MYKVKKVCIGFITYQMNTITNQDNNTGNFSQLLIKTADGSRCSSSWYFKQFDLKLPGNKLKIRKFKKHGFNIQEKLSKNLPNEIKDCQSRMIKVYLERARIFLRLRFSLRIRFLRHYGANNNI